jgi:glycosyltransferase involved in cell wall biosynthesis
MRAVLNAIPDAGRAGRALDAYQEYLPLPAHKKRAAVAAPSAAALTGSCSGLIRDMLQRGHRVLAFAPALSNNDMRFLAQMGVEAYSLPSQLALLDKYRRMRELSTIFTDAHLDVLLVQSARNGAASVAAAKIARIPKVVTVVPELGPAFMEGAGASAWGQRQAMKATYRAIFAWSDAVIFHSPHDRNYVRDRNLLSKSKMQFIVGGWGEDLRRNVQRPLPPLDRGLLFIMAAPLDRLQGVLEYCEAAKAVRQKSRRARFFLASMPDEVVSPLSAGDLRPYKECVQYIGPIADAASAIARCHAVVAPSYGNGAPRSLYQALAVGRPIITSDTRSCRDLVQQGQNGYRVAVRDAGSIARAMTQLLQRPDLLPSMAQESRRLALRLCDVSSVNTLLLETLGL